MTERVSLPLLALIEALERAAEGSPELDGRIYCAINGLVFRSVDRVGFHFEPDAHGTHTHVTKTPYTTSIDAALSLVPDGWFLFAAQEDVTPVIYKGDHHNPLGTYRFCLQWRAGGGRLEIGVGGTLALALCIAALKAKVATP